MRDDGVGGGGVASSAASCAAHCLFSAPAWLLRYHAHPAAHTPRDTAMRRAHMRTLLRCCGLPLLRFAALSAACCATAPAPSAAGLRFRATPTSPTITLPRCL